VKTQFINIPQITNQLIHSFIQQFVCSLFLCGDQHPMTDLKSNYDGICSLSHSLTHSLCGVFSFFVFGFVDRILCDPVCRRNFDVFVIDTVSSLMNECIINDFSCSTISI